jgi:hypothetical protein
MRHNSTEAIYRLLWQWITGDWALYHVNPRSKYDRDNKEIPPSAVSVVSVACPSWNLAANEIDMILVYIAMLVLIPSYDVGAYWFIYVVR